MSITLFSVYRLGSYIFIISNLRRNGLFFCPTKRRTRLGSSIRTENDVSYSGFISYTATAWLRALPRTPSGLFCTTKVVCIAVALYPQLNVRVIRVPTRVAVNDRSLQLAHSGWYVRELQDRLLAIRASRTLLQEYFKSPAHALNPKNRSCLY